MSFVIVEYRYLEPVGDDALTATARSLDPALARRGAEWRRTYLSPERLRMICEFSAPDANAVIEAHREADVPWEAAWDAERADKAELDREREHEQIVGVTH